MVCDTKSGGYCTDVDAYTIKQQQVSVRAKCYNKKYYYALNKLRFVQHQPRSVQQIECHSRRCPTNVKCLMDVSYLFIWVYISIIFLPSLIDLVIASHRQVQVK